MWAYGSDAMADVGDLRGFFHDDHPDMLMYDATIGTQAGGTLKTKVSAIPYKRKKMDADGMVEMDADGNPVYETMPGKYDITLASMALSATEADNYTAAVNMSYRSAMVEVMATDQEDLWTSQMFYVRRNRAPVIRQTADLEDDNAGRRDNGRYGGTSPNPVVVGTAGDHKTLKIDTGDAFFFDDDKLTVAAEVDNPAYADVSVDGDVITLTGKKGTEGPASTRILLRVTDTGGLKSDQLEFALEVDTGPAVKRDKDGNQLATDVTFTLEAAGVDVYVVDVDRFFTAPPTGSEDITYTATSSDVSVATVTSPVVAVSGGEPGDQGGAGEDLTIQVESIGVTTIKLTATEAAADDNARNATDVRYGDPMQTASLTFKVTVVAE
jgi:hypothetical protein